MIEEHDSRDTLNDGPDITKERNYEVAVIESTKTISWIKEERVVATWVLVPSDRAVN